ncbi:MAG: exodeoxyribonuclease V subunit alpha [Gammaproteobacteria bacterium]|nr:exodeoxyribonuclease V subunit alpha [Gammaproteobacteria bacterium]
MLERLERLCQGGALEDLDLHFARLMVRLAGGAERSALALAACLVSRMQREGHVCADLRRLAGSRVFAAAGAEAVTAPELSPWLRQLRAAGAAVGAPGEYRPLVLDQAGRLYLHRYWEYERRVAARLRRLAAARPQGVDTALLRAGLRRLFPASAAAATDWQRVAAAMAVLRRLCIVSGGPGTGKTTTVARILALLLEQPAVPSRIALAAPTGKAAVRLREVVVGRLRELPAAAAALAAVPARAATLHRLLGTTHPGAPPPHRGLPVDIMVLDEASMLDIALLDRLLAQLPETARLLLVGDADQLASVEAGSVLADLCLPRPRLSADFRERLRSLGCLPPPADQGAARGTDQDAAGAPLPDCAVRLERNFRFSEGSGLARLARAIRDGDPDAVLACLEDSSAPGLAWWAPSGAAELERRLAIALREGYADYWRCLRAGADAGEMLSLLAQFRVLAPRREGRFGARRLNERARELFTPPASARRQPWYPGRAVTIGRNDHSLELYNGDTGIALPPPVAAAGHVPPGPQGEALPVAFAAPSGGLRWFSAARLPPHEDAFAATVHKSQGSEFRRVLLLLPPRDHPLLSRELLYTAVTRAREQVTLWGAPEAIRAAVRRRARRDSGLAQRLRAPED